MVRRLLFLLCTLLVGLSPRAQDDAFVFSHLKESDGLSDNVVNCIFKDSRNILWIGTYNGFSRFDGANFYTYKIRKGQNSMINEVVHALCEDRKGKIWCVTNNGVFSYNPLTDSFRNYELRSLGRNRNFYNVLCDRKGTIWVTGAWSLFQFDEKRDSFQEKMKCVDPTDTSIRFLITKNGLAEDPKSNGFWMSTAGGIWYYDAEKEKVSNAFTTPSLPLFAKRNTAALHRSVTGRYWFFDNQQKAIVQFDPVFQKEIQAISVANQVPNVSGATLFEDRNYRLWLSSWTYEMLVVDQSAGNRIQRLYHRPDDNRSIAGNFFWSGYQDANNTIWLGTVAGLSRCNPERNIYKEYRLANQLEGMKNKAIEIVEENPADKSFWLVTRSRQLIHYNPADGQHEWFELNQAVKNKKGDLPGNVSMIRFLNNQVVITTHTGAWQVQSGSRQILPFTGLPKGYSDFTCKELATEGDSVIYFHNGQSLLYWNRITDQTRLIGFDQMENPPNLYGLRLAPGRKVWLMASGNQLVEVVNDKLQLRSLNRNFTREAGVLIAVIPDTPHHLWVLNRGTGIYRYNTQDQQSTLFNETDGLAGNRVHNFVRDGSGKLWSMLYDKVSVYLPSASKFYNFKIPYSESDLGYINHLTYLSNGHILGTIYNELIEFYPERLLHVPVLEKPQISELMAGGIGHAILNNDRILLAPDLNTVRLRFGSMINKEIFPYDLEYKLGGAEKEWTVAGENAEAIYNDLPSGKYEFRVRVKGKNNGWQSEEAVLYFTIRTPFYRSAWFLLSLALIAVGSLYLLYRYRLKQKERLLVLESKAQMLEKEKALVMYENLKQHLNPHFLFNSLTSLSSLIRVDQQMAGDFLDKMSKVYRYILRNRDNEVVTLEEEMKFVQLYIDLQKTRFENGLQVNMQIQEEHHYKRIAPVTLQNLVENAIKHNTADEESPLVIDLFVENHFLIVRNNLQKKKFVETSNRQGLANMESLYRYLSPRPMEIQETTTHFTVKIPLL